MKYPVLALTALLLAAPTLFACAGQDTSKWPDPQTLQLGLTAAEAGWTAYCAAKHIDCNDPKVTAAEQAAQDALSAYAEAYTTGNVTQALLDNLNKAIADIVALIAQFQKKG